VLTSDRFFIGHVMGIFSGLLHSELFRKTKQDNIVCYTLTPNIMNGYEYVMIRYEYIYAYVTG